MNVVLCDDEKVFLTSLQHKIELWAQKNGHSNALMIHTYTSSEDLLEAWEHGLQIDALFLDIQVPNELNGLALAKKIYSVNEFIPIVFVTNYGDYAEEGYVVNALRYLRKPVSQQSIHECMNIIWNRWNLQHSECVVLNLPNQVLRLPVNTILYAEVSGHYCIIKTTNNEQEYKFRQSLENIAKKFPDQLFVQCYRSVIVNLMYVRHITNEHITMADDTVFPVGNIYRAHLLQAFRAYYLEGKNDQ